MKSRQMTRSTFSTSIIFLAKLQSREKLFNIYEIVTTNYYVWSNLTYPCFIEYSDYLWSQYLNIFVKWMSNMKALNLSFLFA